MPTSPHNSLPHSHPRLKALCVTLLILLHALLALSAASTKSATFDEPIHLIGGLSYWKYNDYRIHAENGNLAQRIIALPDAILPGVPDGMDQDPHWLRGSGYPVAWRFIFGDNIDHHTLVLRGRIMVTLASGLLALTLFLAAQKLWGPAGAFTTLAAYALHPIILANAAIMTSDLLAALSFILTTWALWACLHKLTPLRLAALIVSAAAMALIKFSFPLFFPIALAIAGITLWRNHPWRIDLPTLPKRATTRTARAAATLALAAAVIAGVWFLVWAAYGFRYQAVSPTLANNTGGLLFSLDEMLPTLGTPGKILAFFSRWHLLPEAFLYGMAFVFKFSQGRFSLIAGQYFQSGTWWFYPASLFYKTPLPLLALFSITLLGLASIRRRRLIIKLYQAAPWLALALIFMAAAMLSPLNVGVRHILPALAAGLILLGYAAVAYAPRPIITKALAFLLCLALLVESATAWPNYIVHFNPLAGPRQNLYRNFSDSNLDWGQDLPALNTWARANIIDYHTPTSSTSPSSPSPTQDTTHRTQDSPPLPPSLTQDAGRRTQDSLPSPTLRGPLFTSYFGSVPVAAYNLPGQRIQCYLDQPDEALFPVPYAPGIYAISATRLMVFPSAYGPAWSDFLDNAYAERRDFFQRFFSSPSNSPQRAQVQGSLTRNQIGQMLQEFETLRFSRFCAFLRQRQPLHQINGSILIYQVTAEDLERFFLGPTPGNGPVIHNQLPENNVDLPTR